MTNDMQCCNCGAVTDAQDCGSCGHRICAECPVYMRKPSYEELEILYADSEQENARLAEALRHLRYHTDMRGDCCKLLAVGQADRALAALDARIAGKEGA